MNSAESCKSSLQDSYLLKNIYIVKLQPYSIEGACIRGLETLQHILFDCNKDNIILSTRLTNLTQELQTHERTLQIIA